MSVVCVCCTHTNLCTFDSQVRGAHFLMADAEYEQALRYLVFMPHPEDDQVRPWHIFTL